MVWICTPGPNGNVCADDGGDDYIEWIDRLKPFFISIMHTMMLFKYFMNSSLITPERTISQNLPVRPKDCRWLWGNSRDKSDSTGNEITGEPEFEFEFEFEFLIS